MSTKNGGPAMKGRPNEKRHKFRVGQIAFDKANHCYVLVEGCNDPYVELRYWDVLHMGCGGGGSRYAAGLTQLRPLTARERVPSSQRRKAQ
jgi:hypothetical protein